MSSDTVSMLPVAENGTGASKIRKNSPMDAGEMLERLDARRVRVEFIDTDGRLRGKYVTVEKALSKGGIGLPEFFYALSVDDGAYDVPIASADHGFPDFFAIPDWSTLRPAPNEDGVAAVICDVQSKTGEPVQFDGRSALRRTCARLAEAGFDALIGVELEFYLYEVDEHGETALREQHPTRLRPVGRTRQTLSVHRWPDHGKFVADLDSAMESYGIEVEAFSTELGYGMLEAALSPVPPLQAADNAARFKQACKDVARRNGMLASFVAKPHMKQEGAGAHLHQSLLRNGQNVFCPEDELSTGMSETFRHYVGGVVATAGELSVFQCPYANSYRRLDPKFFAPTNISWGIDNRAACLRVITDSRSATRLEHRRGGADFHPYLAIAASLDGGLHGIRNRIEPPRASTGAAYADAEAKPFPGNLRAAAAALHDSGLARQWYGDDFVEHYAASRVSEISTYEALRDGYVPDWELARYLEVT
ncbi:glutamine synthetase family protein [Mycolicibacterium sp. 050158]|uniref:glutamine synthetase family protein n=1 Tax=Mycolicibacterium sp. 050158 TaxID=3090602 RepID=UPI00299DB04E|nr:glutamine synthetase family protein [Mycolicibacterium sp. 050158]MDX1888666.1 glutamine synthetase family protein [Mycolicibacterium sp. 050158]